jgi:cobalt-zinc-cadmium efflux system outer membrane protein
VRLLPLACHAMAGVLFAAGAASQTLIERSASPSTHPASGPAVVTLAAAIESAWRRAVASTEAQGRHQRAQAERDAASRPWAAPPVLELAHRDDRLQRNQGRRETELALAWPMWLPGQRAATGAAAQAALDMAEQAQASARLIVAGEVREAAWSVAAAQAEAALARAQTQSLTRLAEDVDRRVRAGDMARSDALAVQGEVLAAAASEAEAQQRLHTARSRWTLLTGLDAVAELPGAAPGAAVEGTLTTHPELLNAAHAVDVARRRLAAVEASRRDPPEVIVGLRQDAEGGAEPTRSSVMVGLRVPFGTDDRNRPLQVAARADVAVAEAHELRLRERLAADASMARAAVETATRQLQAEQQRAALLRERAQLIDKSFRAGETGLPEQLRALSAAAQADAAIARQQAALGLAHARLQQALGQLP